MAQPKRRWSKERTRTKTREGKGSFTIRTCTNSRG